MSEEQQDLERFTLEISPGAVRLCDTVTGRTATYTGPDRLLNATTELNRLKAEELKTPAFHRLQEEAKKLHLIEPSAFLAALTGYARRQRLSAMLKEVQEIETQAAALLADDARRLADTTALRERLEKMLERTVSPLSEPLSGQQPAAQGEDTRASCADYGVGDHDCATHGTQDPFTIPADDVASLSKPQPY
jgi:hypothetical protein